MHDHPSEQLSTKLTGATKLHIAPVFRVSPIEVMTQGTSEQMIDQGTMTFISYKGHCFGITNHHVTQDFTRNTADSAFMLALKKHVPIPGRLIFTSSRSDIDFPFDVSIFILNESAIRAGGKVPAPLIHKHSPILEGEKYLALGYPGHIRGRLTDQTSHPIYHIVATCQSVSDRNLILQDEIPLSSDIMRFGGISGGAIVEPAQDDTYSIVGIIFEGRGQHEDVEQRSSECDIWIYGIPISTSWMDEILSEIQSRKISLDVIPMKFSVNIQVDGEPN